MEESYGMKELYSVVLKSTSDIEINGIKYSKGEIIAAFDKIMLMTLEDDKSFVTAHGGYDDRPLVIWESTKDVRFSLTQGVFSKTHLALSTNGRLFTKQQNEPILITNREILESNEQCQISLAQTPADNLFVYDYNTGAKITDYSIDDNIITLDSPYLQVVVTYVYNYMGGGTRMVMGQNLLNEFLELEGRTRVKDDKDGNTKTCIIRIPRVKVLSDISIRLGENAIPYVNRINILGCPKGSRTNSTIVEFTYLADDIDADF